MANLHISVSAEPVFHLGPLAITNSILTSLIVTTLIIVVSLWAAKNVKSTKKPSGLQNLLEMIVEALYNLTSTITESAKKTSAIFPFVFSFFLFILLNNLIGLLPGVGTIGFREPAEHAAESTFVPFLRAGTADLNTTLALALISVFSTQVIGVKFLHLSYFKKFFNLKNPIDGFVGILELISEISKIISFAFRLFGNIFAGEVLLTVMASLVPLLIPSVFTGLEIFVGAIQSFVFATLTLVFMNLASTGHDHEPAEAVNA